MGDWGWLIAIYLFLGGIGSGSYLISFAAEKGIFGKKTKLLRSGYYISAPIVAVGALLLITDLGQGLYKPWLILGMFANLSSAMTWGIYIISAFIFVAFIKAFFLWKKKKNLVLLTYIGAFLALATAAYTGMLLAVVEAVPFWNNYTLPVLFVVSALSSALSLNSLLAHYLEKGPIEEVRVTLVHLMLICSEIILLVVFLGVIYSGSLGLVAQISANDMLIGWLALPFWLLLVGAGFAVPLVLSIRAYRGKWGKGKKVKHIVSATNVDSGEVEGEQSKKSSKGSSGSHRVRGLTDLAVIIGGFTLRCLIVFAALPAWNGTLN